MAKTFSIDGRDTRKGAYTDAEVVRPGGSTYPPDDYTPSGSGRSWTSSWRDVTGCLILVTDYTNSGKDHSRYNLPEGELTGAQSELLEEFCTEHWLNLPE